MQELTIIGRIVIPAPIKRNTIVLCDDCGLPVDCSNGDPREKVTTEYADGSKDIKWICSSCVYDQWTQFEEPEYVEHQFI